jgi:hypothetical protein
MKKVMIMSGEASGDLHGANLAREIRKQDPSIALQCWKQADEMLASRAGRCFLISVYRHHGNDSYRAICRVLQNKRFLGTNGPISSSWSVFGSTSDWKAPRLGMVI